MEAEFAEPQPLELRHYLDILKRQRWLIVEAVVLVAFVAGVFSALQTPVYQATADVLLRPNDPREQIADQATRAPVDLDRYASGQVDVIKSRAVLQAAAKTLGSGTTVAQLQEAVGAGNGASSDKVTVSAKDSDKVWARDAANAVTKAYVENRRQFAVANLDRAAEQIQVKLEDLLAGIAEIENAIAGKPASARATATPTAPTNEAIAPEAPTAGPVQPFDAGALPTDEEGLKAARYAAQLQYQSLFSRQQDLVVEASLKQGEAEILDLAQTPGSPISPKPMRNGLLGAVLGLMLGVGAGFLREQLDDRVRSREDAERASGLPVLAELPLDEELAKDDAPQLAMLLRPTSAFAEATRGLRTSVQFLGVDKGVTRLVVTSPVPDDGKSLIAANLAIAFARAGSKTLLVSADLRRPTTGRLFGFNDEKMGLTDLLAVEQTPGNNLIRSEHAFSTTRNAPWQTTNGDAPYGVGERTSILDEYVRITRVEGLSLLLAGTIPPNPAELLGSKRMAGLIEELSKAYDMVIFDCPPVLAVSDALVLADKVDGLLLVAAAGETHKGALTRAVEMVATTGNASLGVVLNKVEKSSSSYYYGTGYEAYGPSDSAAGNGARPTQSGSNKLSERGRG